MTYKATVARGQVVVRGVDLPNGTEVDVTIERPYVLTADNLAAIREGDAAHRRGEWYTVEETLASLRSIGAGHGVRGVASTRGGQADQGAVGRKSRKRTKRVRRRAG
jgi:hypothetical protein